MGDGELILVAGALLAGALAASLLANRVRVPGLVAFIGLGMAIGSDGIGWIAFDDYELARTIGVIALALILFEGGLSAGFPEIRPVLRPAISLAVVGTAITAAITGVAAMWLFNLSLLEGLLVGSILASTDGAAIFALLRGSTLRRKLARTLEGEAGLNDPVAVLLVLGFIEWIQQPDFGLAGMAALFGQQMGIGLVVGLAAGWLSIAALARIKLASAGLYPVASIAVAALAFGAADALHGSGFLAVYVAGLMLGSAQTPARRTMITFHDGLAWVAQLTMFLSLGLLVFPSQLGAVVLPATALALVLALVARPLAAMIATGIRGFGAGERLVLGWAGLRGAVPVVLATFPVIEGVPGSREFFNIVFFAVLLSTILQGSTFEALARALGVTSEEAALPAPLADVATARSLGAEIVEFPVGADDAACGHRVRELGLPRDALLNLIVRGDQAIPPRGSTRVEAGDRLHILVRQEVAIEFRELLGRWRTGPLEFPRPVRPALRGTAPIFTTRQWRQDDGDPSRPRAIGQLEVIEQLRTRRDAPGALVVLEDGRFAVTGRVLLMGTPRHLADEARRRIASAREDADRAWWQEVIGAVAGS
jgi:cell volume regulation protein A